MESLRKAEKATKFILILNKRGRRDSSIKGREMIAQKKMAKMIVKKRTMMEQVSIVSIRLTKVKR